MSLTHLKDFQKPAMRGLVEAYEEDQLNSPHVIDTYMPDENTYSTTFAYDIIKKSNHIAPYIGYGSEPPVMDRNAVASMSGELAKLGLKYIATEEELLAVNHARSNAEQRAVIDQLLVKATDLLDSVRKQVTTSKLQAVLTGQFVQDRGKVKINVDYGVPADHKFTQTGAQAWDTATGTPIADLIAWNDKYVDTNGVQADVIFMSRDVLRILQTNPEVIAEAGSEAGRIPVSAVQDVLDGYGLPPISVINQRTVTYRDEHTGSDVVSEFMPKYRVVFAKSGLGKYLFGPTVENDFEPGIALDAYDNKEPIQSIIRAAATGFPIIENPFLLLYADVANDGGVEG